MSLPIHKPQEIPLDDPRSIYLFQPSSTKPFVATPGAIEAYGDAIPLCLAYLQGLAHLHHGLDYLQVFQGTASREALWFIEDDEGGSITALLPSEY